MTSPKDVAVWVLRHRKGEAAVSVLWLVFAAVFFIFARFHYVESTKSLPPFEVTSRPLQEPESETRVKIKAAGSSLDQPLEDFARDFNAYLDEQNRSSAKANRVAACEFLIACVTALISAGLEWREDLPRLVKRIIGTKGGEVTPELISSHASKTGCRRRARSDFGRVVSPTGS